MFSLIYVFQWRKRLKLLDFFGKSNEHIGENNETERYAV